MRAKPFSDARLPSSELTLCVVVAIAFGLGPNVPSYAGELEVRYTRVIGSGDAIPGAPSGTVFAAVSGGQPAGGRTVFYGQNQSGSVRGYYLHDGTATHRIYDSTQLEDLPGLPPGPLQVYFDSVYAEVHVGASGLAAAAIETSDPDDINSFKAIYGWRDGNLFLVAAKGQPLPGGAPDADFLSVGNPRVLDNTIYFAALRAGTPDIGFYRWYDGSVEEVPFGELHLTSLQPASQRLCSVAFDPNAIDYPYGIWCQEQEAGPVERVFHFGAPFPGGTGVWLGMEYARLQVLDTSVLLASRNSGNSANGLYRLWHESVEPVLTSTDVDPITGDPFTLWWMYSGAGQRVAFTGYDPADFRMRLRLQDEDRSFHKLVDEGDVFEGQQVGLINLHFGGFSGERLAFSLGRSNDYAVWVADFGPDPGPGPGDGPSVLEIPTLDSAARAALVLLLALSGGWVLRRPRGV